MNNETPVLYGVWRNSWERHQLAAAMGIERTFGDYAKAGTREEPLPEPKPLTFRPRCKRVARVQKDRSALPHAMAILGFGPSLPIGINRPHPHETGKADVDWVVNFRPKFSKPAEPKFMTPIGYAEAFETPEATWADAAQAREEELAMLIRTQNLEIAPITAQLRTNGFTVANIGYGGAGGEDEIMDANLADMHLGKVPYSPDPLSIAATSRLIEWEQYKSACGPVCRTHWVVKDDKVGIEYLGERWNDPTYALEQKKRFKYETHGGIVPTVEDVSNNEAFMAAYPKPFLALMSDQEYKAFQRWRKTVPLAEQHVAQEAMHAPWMVEEWLEDYGEEKTGGPVELGLHSNQNGYEPYLRLGQRRVKHKILKGAVPPTGY